MSKLEEDESRLEETIDVLIEKVKKKGRRGIARVVYGRTMMYILLLLVQILFLYLALMNYRQYSTLYFGSFSLLSIIVVVAIINEEINPMYKLAWIMLVVAIPVFGTFTYLMVRFQPGQVFLKKNQDKFGEQMVPYLVQNEATRRTIEGESKDLYNTARYLYSTLNFPVYTNTKTDYFAEGSKLFRRMLIELGKAEKFIFLEYFIIEEGIMWDAILEILKAKVQQGVEVRVMYDGTCCFKLLPYSYPKQLEAMGIKAKIFSPIVPILSIHQNNRDHRKILVIDGKVGFTGGINLADEYINEVERFGHWKDGGVMLKGKAVNSLTCMFLQMWNLDKLDNKLDVEQYDQYMTQEIYENKKGYVIPYGDNPLDKENTGEQIYLDIINQAKDYVYIMTPYLILDHEMLSALKAAAKRGVDLRIVMPHIPDKKYAFDLARSYYEELIRGGVKIYEYIPGFVHSKVFLSDDEKAVVGTINMDYRSLFLNYECGVYMYNTGCIGDLRQDFSETFKKCITVTLEYYKGISLFHRICGKMLRLIAPLM